MAGATGDTHTHAYTRTHTHTTRAQPPRNSHATPSAANTQQQRLRGAAAALRTACQVAESVKKT